MTRSVVGMAIMAVVASTTSAGPQRDLPNPATGTGTIRGTVVGADSMAPLYDVTLSLRSADEPPPVQAGPRMTTSFRPPFATARPNPDGRFEFIGVPPGRYRLVADPGPTAARYYSVRYPDPTADDTAPLTLSANQTLDNIVVPLPRAAAIVGRVVDDRGIGMAWVSVMAEETLAGDRRRIGPGSMPSGARSDDGGNFRLFGLQPGEYVLSATLLRPNVILFETPGSVAGPLTSPRIYYPGTTRLSEALRIRVASGDEYGPVHFTVPTLRLSTIRGLLLDPNGQPASTVSVSLSTPITGMVTAVAPVGSRTTKSDGTFELTNVPPGDHAISVSHYGPQGSWFAWVPITITDDVEGLTVGLQPGVSVSGQVVFEGQAPVPLPTMYVRTLPSRAGGGAAGVTPSSDLSFRLDNQFGPTLIRTDGPPRWHLKAVLQSGRDITDHPVEFTSDGPPLQVVLTQRAAVLSGTVETAAGVAAESSVVLIGDDPNLWHERATTTRITATSGNGKFRFEGLRGGRYLAVATPRDDALTSRTASYFELLANHATPVVIGDGDSKSLQLKRITIR